ncbi:unnamed protein product [Pleuronectes platessa]|uniref:Uncharacterized protein n=1 Tax=Pleuronectes platessa TaxID=8262 RepID=A0A9N7VHN8_PLEPL|nr:unnamed protein product [Pleuronectes platessa]
MDMERRRGTSREAQLSEGNKEQRRLLLNNQVSVKQNEAAEVWRLQKELSPEADELKRGVKADVCVDGAITQSCEVIIKPNESREGAASSIKDPPPRFTVGSRRLPVSSAGKTIRTQERALASHIGSPTSAWD